MSSSADTEEKSTDAMTTDSTGDAMTTDSTGDAVTTDSAGGAVTTDSAGGAVTTDSTIADLEHHTVTPRATVSGLASILGPTYHVQEIIYRERLTLSPIYEAMRQAQKDAERLASSPIYEAMRQAQKDAESLASSPVYEAIRQAQKNAESLASSPVYEAIRQAQKDAASLISSPLYEAIRQVRKDADKLASSPIYEAIQRAKTGLDTMVTSTFSAQQMMAASSTFAHALREMQRDLTMEANQLIRKAEREIERAPHSPMAEAIRWINEVSNTMPPDAFQDALTSATEAVALVDKVSEVAEPEGLVTALSLVESDEIESNEIVRRIVMFVASAFYVDGKFDKNFSIGLVATILGLFPPPYNIIGVSVVLSLWIGARGRSSGDANPED